MLSELTSQAALVLRDMATVDRSKISYVTGLRNALAVLLPLAVGAALGDLPMGLTVSIGALNVAFSDREGPYRLRLTRMAMATVVGALSVFVGSATGSTVPLAVVLTALWGLRGGMLTALGLPAMQVGLTGIILFIVYGAIPLDPLAALEQGGLVVAGGLLATLPAVAAWPVRRHGPERAALATVFRHLGAFAADPSDMDAAPPLSAEIIAANTMLLGIGRERSESSEVFRALLDELERMRLELVALDAERQRLDDTPVPGEIR